MPICSASSATAASATWSGSPATCTTAPRTTTIRRGREFTEFDPFWEFVAGPLHAGTFGPNTLDPTFGPEAKFNGVPPGFKGNRPPSDGFQFFGTMKIDARTRAMTVGLHNLAGERIYKVELPAAR